MNSEGRSSEIEQTFQPKVEERKVTPQERFRRLARTVQSQDRWTKALQSKIAEDHKREFNICRRQSREREEIFSFNASGKRVLYFLNMFTLNGAYLDWKYTVIRQDRVARSMLFFAVLW